MTRATDSHADLGSVAGLRSLAEIENRHRELELLLQDPPSSYGDETLSEVRGAVAALAWLAGLEVEAPVSGAIVVQPRDLDAVWDEYEVAERVAMPNAFPGQRPPVKAMHHDRAFVFGARDALRWVVGDQP